MQARSTPDSDKQARQTALRKLLADRTFKNQAELAAAMKKRGFAVTQSSISRDLRDLRVARVQGRYQPQPDSAAADTPSLFSQFVLSVQPAGENLLVLKTASGAANAVAEEIDNGAIAGLVGTVAGDNTIFLATGGRSGSQKVMKALRRIGNAENFGGGR